MYRNKIPGNDKRTGNQKIRRESSEMTPFFIDENVRIMIYKIHTKKIIVIVKKYTSFIFMMVSSGEIFNSKKSRTIPKNKKIVLVTLRLFLYLLRKKD